MGDGAMAGIKPTWHMDHDDHPIPGRRPPLRFLGDLCVLGVLAVARPLARLGLHRPPDAWRRATSLGLRSEGSKFALSAFGLDLWSDAPRPHDAPAPTASDAEAQVVRRLARFLQSEPLAQLAVRHRGVCATAVPRAEVDLAIGQYDERGRLRSLDALLDERRPIAAADQQRGRDTLQSIARAFSLNGAQQPVRVAPRLGAAVDQELARRVLAATMISFEPMPHAEARFLPPSFEKRPGMPLGAFNMIARLSADRRSADLWVQVHHAVTDGVPVQEMLGRLQGAWGVRENIIFPTPEAFAPHAVATRCSPANVRREIWCVQDFIDFEPLLTLRHELNERPDVQAGGGITLATLLVWCLAHQPEFAGRKFASTVDVPPAGEQPRGVNFLSIRPADFFGALNHGAAMVGYAHEASRLLNETRLRCSPTSRAMDTLAMLPSALHLWALRANPDRTADTFGTVGVTVLREAAVFVAPISDFGFDDGFIAIGSMLLPAEGGRRVGAITCKGAHQRIAAYPQAIRRAVANCRQYV